jgi:hypothetical protein
VNSRGVPRDAYSADVEVDGDSGSKISAVALAASGSVAWLACPPAPSPSGEFIDLRSGPRATCRRLGANVFVFRHFVGGPDAPELLAHSRQIDPGSFHLTGAKLSWRQDGRVITRTLR